MLGRFLAEPDRSALREEPAEITGFDEASRSYTVLWRGASVGPVWSANAIRHPIGAKVAALVKDGLVLRIVP